MILNTDRLVLAPLLASDAADAYPLLSDAEAMAHWDVEPLIDPDAVDAVIAAQADQTAAGSAAYWSIRTREGEFVGLCDLSSMDRWHSRSEVGFMIAPRFWRRGYALEALTAVLEYAAANGFKRLTARTHVGNAASEALLERLGFEKEGYLRGHIERDGERRDCRLWGLLL